MDRLLTINAVAEVLSVSRGTVYRLLHNGEFEAVMVNNRWRVRESDLKRYIKRLPNALPVRGNLGSDDLEYIMEHRDRTGEYPAIIRSLNIIEPR
jgi:excisionase family DNA binding protein